MVPGLGKSILQTLAVEAGRAIIAAGLQKWGQSTALRAAPRSIRIDPIERDKWLKARGLSDQRRGKR